MKRRAYASVSVNLVDVRTLRKHSPQAVVVGLDVGKFEIFAVCHWADGSFERAAISRMPGAASAPH